MNVNQEDTHEFYVRGLYNYDDWNSNTNPQGRGDESYELLERAWYGLNVNRFLGWDTDGSFTLDFHLSRSAFINFQLDSSSVMCFSEA